MRLPTSSALYELCWEDDVKIQKAFHLALVATAGLVGYSTAHADNCTGRVSNVSIGAETIEVAKGHTLAIFSFYSITSSENSPNNATGKCGGYALTTPDGKTRLVGSCARKTKDGDSWSDEWAMEPGAQRGTWKLLGGTGVFAGMKASGWWQPVADDGKMSTAIWGGNCN
jgi:hypothetical protein